MQHAIAIAIESILAYDEMREVQAKTGDETDVAPISVAWSS